MAITLELPSEEEQNLRRQAEMAGQDVANHLLNRAGFRTASPALSEEEWERLAEEAMDLVDPSLPPLSDYAVSREGIYRDHDCWRLLLTRMRCCGFFSGQTRRILLCGRPFDGCEHLGMTFVFFRRMSPSIGM